MPTFTTPEPISATIDVVSGDVRVTASERADTVVEVQPTDASNREDVRAAEQTRVDFTNDHLIVKTPKLRSWLPRSDGGSVAITIELPAGSRVQGSGQLADFRADGPLGEVRIKTGLGAVQLDEVGTLMLTSGTGDVSVDRVTGDADVKTGSGDVRVRELASSAVIKNSNGDTWVGTANRDLRVNAANGDIAIDLANADVNAKSANGDVRLGEAVRGAVALETKLGDVEVGISEGTSAWLDVNASAGKVHNALEAADGPEPSGEKLEVRARTTVGAIVIRRAS
jgi:Putative adhesin